MMLKSKIEGGPETRGGTPGRLLRRIIHGALSLCPIYYLFPDIIPLLLIPKWTILIFALVLLIIIEFWRLRTGRVLFGMRPHEGGRLASYAYASLGVVIVLLFVPMEIGAPCIIAMAWTDPIAGEARLFTRSKIMGGGIFAISYLAVLMVIFTVVGLNPSDTLVLTLILLPVAIVSESADIAGLDDDLTLLLFPSIVGTAVWVLLLS